MIRKSTIVSASLVAALALSVQTAQAQDIHFTQFEAAPLIINPAFTGNFDGMGRVTGIYRNQWASVTVPYLTYGASFDAPVIHDLSVDDYLAVGLQLYKDQAGDANLSNFTGLLSVAYHKFLGAEVNKVLSVGLQGGYSDQTLDLSQLYFGDEYVNGTFQRGTSQEYQLGLLNQVKYYTVNAGISFAHSPSQAFSYVLAVGANNLNQPANGFSKEQSNQVGLDMRYTGQAGAIWNLSERFSLRPAVLYQSQATASEIIAGNEFHYVAGNSEFPMYSTAFFIGGWYRTGDAVMATVGVEYKGVRIGVAYDYNISDLQTASNGNGGFEIALRYIMPTPLDFAHKLVYPCSRF
jgi:type IX secretion system PorP/SprF family membrane protein